MIRNDNGPEQRLRTALQGRALAGVLDDRDWRELAARMRVADFAPGEVLFHEGGPCEALPLVLSGEVKLVKAGPEGREHVLHLTRPGAFCDVGALFYSGGLPCTAEAVTTGRALWLDKKTLQDSVTRNPALAGYLLRVLAHRQRLFINKVAGSQGVISVARRVAGWLLHRSRMEKSDSIALSGTRELWARLLGVSRESLSRELNALARAGVIRLERRSVELLRRDILEKNAHE